eukprot:6982056-Pyramimonas_sp.AAC.1
MSASQRQGRIRQRQKWGQQRQKAGATTKGARARTPWRGRQQRDSQPGICQEYFGRGCATHAARGGAMQGVGDIERGTPTTTRGGKGQERADGK